MLFIVTIVLVNLAFFILFYLYNKLKCGINKCSKHLVGKVVIITGANAGIGYETAKDLAERGAKVIMGCRNIERGTAAKDKIVSHTGNKNVHFKQLDLTSFKSVRAFAEDILKDEPQLDILINNAGIIGTEFKKTEDGLLSDLQVNHFGHFLLTSLLLPLLKSSAPSRIINVSSSSHTRGKIDFDDINMEKNNSYSPHQAYSNSKLFNVLMTAELSKRLKGTGVTVNSVHPGLVNTDILNELWFTLLAKTLFGSAFKSPWEGAQTSIYVAVSPEVKDISGEYFADCRIKPTSALSRDTKIAEKLWHVSEKLTKLK